MDYLQAAAGITAELEARPTDEGMGAGLPLALTAWRHLGRNEPAWDRFGLEILAVNELVPELAHITVDCDPPHAGDTRNAAHLVRLLTALAACLEAGAADVNRPLANRLARDAAAIAGVPDTAFNAPCVPPPLPQLNGETPSPTAPSALIVAAVRA